MHDIFKAFYKSMFTFKLHLTASTGIRHPIRMDFTCTSSLCDFSQPGARALEQEVETQRGRGRGGGGGAVSRDAQSSGMHFICFNSREEEDAVFKNLKTSSQASVIRFII